MKESRIKMMSFKTKLIDKISEEFGDVEVQTAFQGNTQRESEIWKVLITSLRGYQEVFTVWRPNPTLNDEAPWYWEKG